MTVDRTLMIGGAVMAFLIIVMATAAVRLSAVWLKNQRELRRHEERRASLRSTARMDEERAKWFALVREKDQRIAELNAELMRVSRDYGNAKKLMTAVKLAKEA